jgi:hypothetical protein
VRPHPVAEVPPTLRLYAVPHDVTLEVPPVRGYRSVVPENRMALVDARTRRIVDVVPPC